MNPLFNARTTKRSLFAALAMQSLITLYDKDGPDRIAAWAVEHADALISALEKEDADEQTN